MDTHGPQNCPLALHVPEYSSQNAAIHYFGLSHKKLAILVIGILLAFFFFGRVSLTFPKEKKKSCISIFYWQLQDTLDISLCMLLSMKSILQQESMLYKFGTVTKTSKKKLPP